MYHSRQMQELLSSLELSRINNIPSIISQVECGEGSVYANLTPTLGGREARTDSKHLFYF